MITLIDFHHLTRILEPHAKSTGMRAATKRRHALLLAPLSRSFLASVEHERSPIYEARQAGSEARRPVVLPVGSPRSAAGEQLSRDSMGNQGALLTHPLGLLGIAVS